MRWETCRDHCFYEEYTFAYLYDGNKCGCLELSGFKTSVVGKTNCSLICSGSFDQKCGGPIAQQHEKHTSYYAVQIQVCNPGYYGAGCAYPCTCRWLFPCDVITGECGNGRRCGYLYEHYHSSPNAFRCDREQNSEYRIFQFAYDLVKRMKNFFTRDYEIPETCPDGFYDIYCLSRCHCKNATCDRVSGVCFVHGCTVGWLGGRCDKVDVCVSNPCQNGGTCERLSQSHVCHCLHGYTGMKCHIVDPCISEPCQNGGTCKSMDDIFECKCSHYFSGSLCTLDHRDIEVISSYLFCVRSGDPSLGELYALPHKMSSEWSMTTGMSVEYCVKYCRIKKFKYAGLRNGNDCFCGETYDTYGSLSMDYCNEPCKGNASQQCGSQLTFSIHSTCPLGSYKLDCKARCHCRGFKVQCEVDTGRCPDDLCAPGYVGERCDESMPPPLFSMSFIMMAYQMTLALFLLVGICVTFQIFIRRELSEKQKNQDH